MSLNTKSRIYARIVGINEKMACDLWLVGWSKLGVILGFMKEYSGLYWIYWGLECLKLACCRVLFLIWQVWFGLVW